MEKKVDPLTAKAILVGIQLPSSTEAEHQGSMAELARLVRTLGFEVVASLSQKRQAPHPGTAIGEGKLEELAAMTQANDERPTPLASLVIFNDELTPNQLKLVEDATGAEVLDRTAVIVEIFNRHAQSREAKLQVEIAKLSYAAPRLRASRVGGDRQGGGIGSKGAGETAHELDKRRIRDRISELRRQLAEIAESQGTRRKRRGTEARVALVGYTNAGKSSLMRSLTGSDVLVEDKLFATLDTTVRALYPETTPKILASDTVGFIKRLPHDLVASFRSTLDEANNAGLLLHVVDASDVTFRSHMETTNAVLAEIGADAVPMRLVLNKVDRLTSVEIEILRQEFPDSIMISALERGDVLRLREVIIHHFEADMVKHAIVIPYTQASLIGKIRSLVRVVSESHDDVGYHLEFMATEELAASFHKLLSGSEQQPEF